MKNIFKPLGNEVLYCPIFMKLALIGYMGSGKSTVGIQLATTLGYEFIDLDAQIELLELKTISELFSEKGEIYFRRKENEILKSIVNSEMDVILATGGGTPCYGDIMSFLSSEEKVLTIYLQTSLDILTSRLLSEKNERPLISHIEDKDSLKEYIGKHLFERSYYYNQAKIHIRTDDLSVDEIVSAIVAQLF